jgi:hypothetical protein
VREATLVETCQRLTDNSDGRYQATGTPKSLNQKFITEDVPTELNSISALGLASGVGIPAIDALVEVVRRKIAARHNNDDLVSETWLVISASCPIGALPRQP